MHSGLPSQIPTQSLSLTVSNSSASSAAVTKWVSWI